MNEPLSAPTLALLDRARGRAMEVPFDPESLLADLHAHVLAPPAQAPVVARKSTGVSIALKVTAVVAVTALAGAIRGVPHKQPHRATAAPLRPQPTTPVRNAQQHPRIAPPALPERAVAPIVMPSLVPPRRTRPVPLRRAESEPALPWANAPEVPVAEPPQSDHVRQVNALLRLHQPEFQACFDREADPTRGLMHATLSFLLGAGGEVSDAAAVWFDRAPSLGPCIESTLRRIRFPPPPGGATWFRLPLCVTPAGGAPLLPPAPLTATPMNLVELPERPTRVSTVAAMGAVSPAIAACGAFDQVAVTFDFLPQGVVRAVSVHPTAAVAPFAECIARAARAARIEPFRAHAFTVIYPFSGSRPPPDAR